MIRRRGSDGPERSSPAPPPRCWPGWPTGKQSPRRPAGPRRIPAGPAEPRRRAGDPGRGTDRRRGAAGRARRRAGPGWARAPAASPSPWPVRAPDWSARTTTSRDRPRPGASAVTCAALRAGTVTSGLIKIVGVGVSGLARSGDHRPVPDRRPGTCPGRSRRRHRADRRHRQPGQPVRPATGPGRQGRPAARRRACRRRGRAGGGRGGGQPAHRPGRPVDARRLRGQRAGRRRGHGRRGRAAPVGPGCSRWPRSWR